MSIVLAINYVHDDDDDDDDIDDNDDGDDDDDIDDDGDDDDDDDDASLGAALGPSPVPRDSCDCNQPLCATNGSGDDDCGGFDDIYEKKKISVKVHRSQEHNFFILLRFQ